MAGMMRGGAPGGVGLGAAVGVPPGGAQGGFALPGGIAPAAQGGAFPAGPAPTAVGGAAGGAAAPAAGFQRVKALPRFCFEGKVDEDWLSFRDMFRNYARFGGYTEAEAKSALNLCMRGTAQRAVSAIDPLNPALSYDNMVLQYEAKFLPASASALARTQYEEARQGPKEPILTYHGRLQTLLLRAHPDLTVDATVFVRKFITGLYSKPVRTQVLRMDPQTYTAALNAAQAEHAVLEQGKVNPMTDVTSAGDGRGPYQSMDINAIDIATAVCHNCQKVGHLQRDCPHPRREKSRKEPLPPRSGSRPGRPADRSRSKSATRKPDAKKNATWGKGGNYKRRLADQHDPQDGATSAEEEDPTPTGKPEEEPEEEDETDSADSGEQDF